MHFPKFGGKDVEHKDRAGDVQSPDAASADITAEQKVTFAAAFLGLVASIGGFMFGYVRYVLLFSTPSASARDFSEPSETRRTLIRLLRLPANRLPLPVVRSPASS